MYNSDDCIDKASEQELIETINSIIVNLCFQNWKPYSKYEGWMENNFKQKYNIVWFWTIICVILQLNFVCI